MRTVTLSGETFTVADGYDKFWRKANEGRWERTTFEAIARCVTPRTACLDIGAWIGPTVLFTARKGARVVAFEPDPASAAVLRENLCLNPDCAAKVTVHEAAVWTSGGRHGMGNRNEPGDSMSSLLEEGAPHSWQVDCFPAADLTALFDPEEPLFVKIDVEGAEYAVLPHLTPLLDRPKVDVLVALHPHVVSPGFPRLPRTRRLTRDAFAVFEGFDAYRVSRRAITRSAGAALARATGRWVFEAKDNYLFRRDRTA